jgi:hypothetical protein
MLAGKFVDAKKFIHAGNNFSGLYISHLCKSGPSQKTFLSGLKWDGYAVEI